MAAAMGESLERIVDDGRQQDIGGNTAWPEEQKHNSNDCFAPAENLGRTPNAHPSGRDCGNG
jgi:hypothetical protein